MIEKWLTVKRMVHFTIDKCAMQVLLFGLSFYLSYEAIPACCSSHSFLNVCSSSLLPSSLALNHRPFSCLLMFSARTALFPKWSFHLPRAGIGIYISVPHESSQHLLSYVISKYFCFISLVN